MNDSTWIIKIEFQSILKYKIPEVRQKKNYFNHLNNKRYLSKEVNLKDLSPLVIRNFYLKGEREVLGKTLGILIRFKLMIINLRKLLRKC